MPRRIPDYPDSYYHWNMISSYGSLVSVISIILLFYILYRVFSDKILCTNNYWFKRQFFDQTYPPNVGKHFVFNYTPTEGDEGSSIEWILTSPPSFHEFLVTPILK